MNRNTIAVLNARNQGRPVQGWIFLTSFADKCEHLGGKLVSLFGAALVGQ